MSHFCRNCLLAIGLLFAFHAQAKQSLAQYDHFSLALTQKIDSKVNSTTLSLGINLPKKYVIQYIPYIGAFLRHSRLPLSMVSKGASRPNQRINSAIVGFNLGLIFPVTTMGYRYFVFTTVGSGKSSVQADPWWGTRESSLSDKAVAEADFGVRFVVRELLFGFSYSISNINYLDDSHLVSVGVRF